MDTGNKAMETGSAAVGLKKASGKDPTTEGSVTNGLAKDPNRKPPRPVNLRKTKLEPKNNNGRPSQMHFHGNVLTSEAPLGTGIRTELDRMTATAIFARINSFMENRSKTYPIYEEYLANKDEETWLMDTGTGPIGGRPITEWLQKTDLPELTSGTSVVENAQGDDKQIASAASAVGHASPRTVTVAEEPVVSVKSALQRQASFIPVVNSRMSRFSRGG